MVGTMRIRLLALTALATLAAASPAMATTIVHDPDEPAIANDNDIEWATASGRFVVGTGWLYTVSVKTRAPYAARPCVSLRVNGTTRYRLCGIYIQSAAGKSRLTVSESPAGNVISYTINAAQIGNASGFEWVARTTAAGMDFAPDAGYASFERTATTTRSHSINTTVLEMPWIEMDPRSFDGLPDCITC
jgi:hypothetical protein